MYTIHKLKPDRSITGLIPAFSSLIIMALIGIFFGVKVAFTSLAIFYWGLSVYTFIGFLRTSNANFIIPTLFQFFAGFVAYTFEPKSSGNSPPFLMFAVLATIVFLVWVILLVVTKKIKWRGREVLEMAAAPVEETGNGYTSRPLPAGKVEFSQEQIMEFATFARRHLIAVSYVGKDKIIFVPVMMGREFGFIMGLKNDYTDETWVSFDFDGNVTVNICHRDYLEYIENLSFEQLCTSLGNLFVEFIDMHLRGEGVRIIDRMDAVRVGAFS
jgi:hypothetical protein